MKRAPGLLLLAFLAAYAPDVGHGFVKDDFGWIANARLENVDSVRRLLFGEWTFYRPITSLSFGLNHLVFDLHSYGYGLTNLAIAIGCAVVLVRLAIRLGLSWEAALFGGAVWAFNFHGINMGVLWLSGRTSLLATLFALCAALAATSGHRVGIFVATLLALGSKEEALVLPAMLTFLTFANATADKEAPRYQSISAAISRTWPAWIALGMYLVLRANAGALTPSTAPSFYQFNFEVGHVLRNIVEYADRSSTLAVAATLLTAAAFRRRPAMSPHLTRVAIVGAGWLVTGFALTLWLPIRSSLYAVYPSVGAAILAAACVEGVLTGATAAHRARLRTAVAIVPFLLLPVHWSRNERWVELADLTADTLAAIQRESSTIPDGTRIELLDDPTTRANFSSAFSTLAPDAALLFFGGRYHLWIASPLPEANAGPPPEATSVATFRVRDGIVERVQ